MRQGSRQSQVKAASREKNRPPVDKVRQGSSLCGRPCWPSNLAEKWCRSAIIEEESNFEGPRCLLLDSSFSYQIPSVRSEEGPMELQTCVSLVTGVALTNLLWGLVGIPVGRQRHRRQHSETCHSLHRQRISEIKGRAQRRSRAGYQYLFSWRRVPG